MYNVLTIKPTSTYLLTNTQQTKEYTLSEQNSIMWNKMKRDKKNERTFTWDHINETLFNMGLPTRRLIGLLNNLPRNTNTYTWETLNGALMSSGFSSNVIARYLSALTK